MKKAGKTATLPETALPVALDGPDLVTALRICGASGEFPLLARQGTFTLGSSPSCDVAIDSPYLSALQLVLERRDGRIRVHDQASKNGTVFKGRAERTFDLGAGDVLTTAGISFLALSEDMRTARAVFAELLGLDDDKLSDETLREAASERPLLVIAEPGADERQLSRALHDASLRRGGPFVPLGSAPASLAEGKSAVGRARRGTLVVPVAGTAVDAAFVGMLLSADFQVRAIAEARTLEAAVKSLGLEAVSRFHQVVVRPLRERASDIPVLLERAFLAERASLRFIELTEKNQAALRRCPWPENLIELREAGRRIAGLAQHGSIRQASAKLGIPRTTFQYWVDGLDLEVPVTRVRA
jgi:hypothetical protein